jgi:(1->4)-alpha-D-glucan 1-alpha-D-glucosylmutase
VPDLYQGAELWDLSLVDPDNRRPVDYKLRANLLSEVMRMAATEVAGEVMRRADEGLPKLWTIHQALCLRLERPASFGAEAAYTPMVALGQRAEHVIAYLRGSDVVTIVPRLAHGLEGGWKDTSVELPEGRWVNRLTGATVEGGRVAIADALLDFPVALLVKERQ